MKNIYQTLIQLVKNLWALPQAIAQTKDHRRQRVVLAELEVERLDRIRNPSKYRGKDL